MSSVTYMMLCGTRDQSCGQQAIGVSITTMLQHIPDMAVPQTQEAIERKAILDIMTSMTVELNTIPKEAFLNVPINGGTAGRSDWSPKETTERVIRFPTLEVHLLFSHPKVGYFPNLARISFFLSLLIKRACMMQKLHIFLERSFNVIATLEPVFVTLPMLELHFICYIY